MELPFLPKYNFTFAIFTFSIIYFSSIVRDFVQSQSVVPNNDYFCSDGFCPEWLRQNPCSTNTSRCNTTGFRQFLDPDRCNCCNYCFDYLKENATCSPHSLEKPVEMCGPFLECRADSNSQTATCRRIGESKEKPEPVTPCLALRNAYLTNKIGIVQFLPDCDAHGYFSPRQCLPGSICYCSDRYGNRIFGESQPNDPQDCACARDVARLQEFGFQGKFPHCLPNGDYDELQCVIRSCYCKSDPSKVYYPQKMNELPCFNQKIHTFDPIEHRYYNRKCESHRAELEVQRLEAEINGTLMIISDLPTCSPDGNYDRKQASKYDIYCSDPDGIQIEDFEARKFSREAENMNCYCARARHMLSESATGKPKCCHNGNYQPYQCVGSTCFCVDELGRQIVNITTQQAYEVSDDKVKDLPCFVNSC